jgi:hypothetical protein
MSRASFTAISRPRKNKTHCTILVLSLTLLLVGCARTEDYNSCIIAGLAGTTSASAVEEIKSACERKFLRPRRRSSRESGILADQVSNDSSPSSRSVFRGKQRIHRGAVRVDLRDSTGRKAVSERRPGSHSRRGRVRPRRLRWSSQIASAKVTRFAGPLSLRVVPFPSDLVQATAFLPTVDSTSNLCRSHEAT